MGIEKKYYIKYPLDYKLLHNVLETTGKKRLNIFIDLLSICRGLYKKEVIFLEVNHYLVEKKISGLLIQELKEFLNNLYRHYKKYDIFIILFFDDGICQQNRMLDSQYKSGRSIDNLIFDDNANFTDLFRKIRKYYYHQIVELFNKEDLCSVQYIPQYECDIIPYYCGKYNIFDSSDSDLLSIILSHDKDLLQTLEFPNFLQLISSFKRDEETGKYKVYNRAFDRKNAISYIYPRFIEGILDARYISLLLAISGDKSDNIPNAIPGIGISKAIKLLTENNIPHSIDEIKNKLDIMPSVLKNNIDAVIKNYKLVSFSEQIKRLPRDFLV